MIHTRALPYFSASPCTHFDLWKQALADRASRGLSLMSGFKSRQEKVRGADRCCVFCFIPAVC